MKIKELIEKVCFDKDRPIRFDIFIRYLGVKNYVEKGKLHPLYVKLWKERAKSMSKNPNPIYSDKRFIDIIDSFMKHGYLSEYPILLQKNHKLLEGAHRIACCLYFKIDDAEVKITKIVSNMDNLKWYEDRFTKDEVKLILETRDKLLDRLHNEP